MLRVVLIYMAVAAVWILVSDRLVRVLVTDPDLRTPVSMLKGWVFVLVTGLLLYVLLRREARYWTEERMARNEAEAAQRLQNKRQQLLLEASRLASETTGSEHELSVALMRIVGPHIEADICFHYRLENDGEHLDLIAGIGLPPRHSHLIQRVGPDNTFVGAVAKSGKMMVVDSRTMKSDDHGAVGRLLGVKAYVAAPLTTRDGRVLGTLSFGSFKREAFSNEEVEMIEIVSRFASLATERLRTMAALRESESRFRQMADSLPQMVWTSDASGSCDYLSQNWVDYTGIPAAQQLGNGWLNRIHPEDRLHLMEKWARALAAGSAVQVEFRICGKNGGYRWFDTRALPLRGSDGRILKWFGSNTDVTERMQTEMALREIQERQRLFIEHAPAALAMFDREMRYLAVSRRWLSDYGLEGRDVIGVSHYTVFPEITQRLKDVHRRALLGEVIAAESDPFERANGTVQWLRWEVRPWRNAENQIGGIMICTEDITAKLKGETALRESEARYRLLAEHTADVIWVMDLATQRFTYVSPSVERLRGYTPEEVLQQTMQQAVTPGSFAMITEILPARLAAFAAGDPSATSQVHAVEQSRKDGTTVWTEVVTTLIKDSAEALQIVGVSRDITVRRKMETALHASEEQSRSVVESAADAIFIQTQGNFAYLNPAAVRLFGARSAEELVGKPVLDCVHPDFRESTRQRIRQLNEKREATILTMQRFLRRDGAVVDAEVSGVPFVHKGEHGALVFARDITERKQAEWALRESEERFRQVVENIEEVFWVSNPAQRQILYVSPAYEKIWGRSCESLYAKPGSWIEAMHPDDRERVLAAGAARVPGEGYTETYRILRSEKQVRWVQVRVFPVRDSVGNVFRMVGTAMDITEHRKLEEQFHRAQKMEAIGTLAGGIAHDFNNILGAIGGFAELAKLDPSQETTDISLDEILKASKRASDLVRQILAFSRQNEQKRIPIQLWRVVDEATRLLRAALPSTIKFEIDLAKEVPTVLADATQIHQVVMNLCTNAAHAMAGRSGLLQVKLEPFEMDAEFAAGHPGATPGPHARLEIKDNGHGMDHATLERIFEPFFTTKAPGEGTGLGLSVVHGIVQNHEGVITVYSRPGEGTIFNLYFHAYHQAETPATPVETALPAGKGERILVVDDEVQLTRMTSAMLSKLGYDVDTSTQPMLALQKVTDGLVPYDLVITDLTMPEMTGVEFVTHILLASPKTRIVLMTGFMTKEQHEQILKLGVREILSKPVNLRTLAETVFRTLRP